MHKISQIKLVYNELCLGELKKKYDNNPEVMEYILFLMQCNALKNGYRPVYKYKTYIYEGKIRIKFMSDLLRVMPLTKVYVEPRAYSVQRKEVKINRELIQEYMKLTKDEIRELVDIVLENGILDSKYFVFKKYNNKIMRLYARFQVFTSHHRVLSIVYNILVTFFLAMIATSIGVLLLLMDIGEEYASQIPIAIKVLLGFITISGIPTIAWTLITTRPTKYEKDNHFND